MSYGEKAEILHAANFRVYGLGNFDVTESEVAEILELVEQNDATGLKKLYGELKRIRMGTDA